MSKVRVLVGTRKGAFILTSDGKRDKWDVSGPHFAGWEIYHLKGSPADPNRIFASQTSGWFGQIIQRSDDGGKTWHQPGTPPGEATTAPDGTPKAESNKFVYDTSTETGAPLTTHQFYDGTQHPWEFKRVWHLEPSLTIPILSTLASKTQPSSAQPMEHRTGRNFPDCVDTARVRSGSRAQAECASTPSSSIRRTRNESISRSRQQGAFRTDDEGKTWKPINKGLHSQYIPDPNAEVGHCVHHVAMHPQKPDVLFMQKHWDVMRSDDAGDNWKEISGNLPTDFGFVIDVHAHEPETIYVVPIKSDSEHFVPDGKLRVYRSRSGGNEWEPLTKGLPQSNCYVNVLRDAMAVDKLDECGIYFGTSGGQVYASADAGDSWNPIVRDLPPVLSVEVQTLK
jgi:photosystem II stability/assembly factor-like uncharacterized protein